MQKLPIGIQTFQKLREDNYIYIDKTKEALELIQKYEYSFLSRPRRFGKSLFLSTLKSIFQGKKELFKDLYIYDKYDFKPYPVIHVSFSGRTKTKEGIAQVFDSIVKDNQDTLDIACDEKLDPPNCLRYLIKQAYKKYNQKVVVLIDEYDKLILDNILDKPMRDYARDELKGFYEILKDSDDFIRFVFITGVSKFAKVSIFSGLNNLEDISLNPDFGNICGYATNDLKTTLKEHLKDVSYDDLALWYNGYNFLKGKMYNPFDILLFIRNHKEFKSYWFETGSPKFLIDLIKEKKYNILKLNSVTIDENALKSFDIDNIDLELLLFQTGYLTIDEVKKIGTKFYYTLKIPNLEVKSAFTSYILEILYTKDTPQSQNLYDSYFALNEANFDELKRILTSLFASISYRNFTNNYIENYEGFYASVLYAFFSSLALSVETEKTINSGIMDLKLEIEDKLYIIEFKVDSKNALEQIKQKEYAKPYLASNKQIYLLGICFDSKARNISEFEWERVE